MDRRAQQSAVHGVAESDTFKKKKKQCAFVNPTPLISWDLEDLLEFLNKKNDGFLNFSTSF